MIEATEKVRARLAPDTLAQLDSFAEQMHLSREEALQRLLVSIQPPDLTGRHLPKHVHIDSKPIPLFSTWSEILTAAKSLTAAHSRNDQAEFSRLSLVLAHSLCALLRGIQPSESLPAVPRIPEGRLATKRAILDSIDGLVAAFQTGGLAETGRIRSRIREIVLLSD